MVSIHAYDTSGGSARRQHECLVLKHSELLVVSIHSYDTSGGSARRQHECLVLEHSELLVVSIHSYDTSGGSMSVLYSNIQNYSW